ncbi:hypothetical protein QL285_012606 [Trifolium repens]|nr:hypothetical protein QL285_068770 [Trifolium repens]KAK2441288.1 hypothetical protein QL285_012606 [Trifolium repens]
MIQYLIFLRAQLILKIVLGEGQIHRGWGCNRNGAVIIQKGCYSTQVQVDLTSAFIFKVFAACVSRKLVLCCILAIRSPPVLVFGEAAGLLGGYIGSVGTSFNKFPIDKLRWPDVSSKIKDEVYKDNIQTKFDVNDGIHKHHILGKIGKRFQTWTLLQEDDLRFSASHETLD